MQKLQNIQLSEHLSSLLFERSVMIILSASFSVNKSRADCSSSVKTNQFIRLSSKCASFFRVSS